MFKIALLIWVLLIGYRYYDWYTESKANAARLTGKKKVNYDEKVKPRFDPDWNGFEIKKIKAQPLNSSMKKSVSVKEKDRKRSCS